MAIGKNLFWSNWSSFRRKIEQKTMQQAKLSWDFAKKETNSHRAHKIFCNGCNFHCNFHPWFHVRNRTAWLMCVCLCVMSVGVRCEADKVFSHALLYFILFFFCFPWGSPEPQSFGPNIAFFREALAILWLWRGMGMDFGLQTGGKLVGRHRELNLGPPAWESGVLAIALQGPPLFYFIWQSSNFLEALIKLLWLHHPSKSLVKYGPSWHCTPVAA